jgi:putative ABC transport system permease protein
MSPRWRKVAADLWGNKTRTLLVILSIAVGVFAVGMIAGSQDTLTRDLVANHRATTPSHATIFARDPFDEDFIDVARATRGVAEAQGRRRFTVRFRAGDRPWRALDLIALPDYDKVRVNRLRPKGGAWPPPDRQIVVEQSSLAWMGIRVGDHVEVELPDGTRRRVRAAGLVHDLSQFPSFFSGSAYGFITMDTLEWLGEPRELNQIDLRVAERATDGAHIRLVAGRVRDKLEASGRAVFRMWVPPPGKHWADDTLRAVALVLGVLGFFSLLLSAFLVINTVSALLAQQMRQIGVMKAIGARTPQIAGMYLATVLAYCVLSLFVAVPLGAAAAQWNTNYIARLMNFDVLAFRIPPSVLALEAAVGIVVPLLAALAPIRAGTRVTVREAVSDYGLGGERLRTSRLDRAIENIRGLPRPLLLSLRNTFRRKGRLALTLATLTLAGAMLISVRSVSDSLRRTNEDIFQYWGYNLTIDFARAYRTDQIVRETLRVPGTRAAETWGFASAHRVRADGADGENLLFVALPAASRMVRPDVLRGRWLVPGDENAVVVNTDVLKEEADVNVGDEIVLKAFDRKTRWRVVGIVRGVLQGPFVYANSPFASSVTRDSGRGRRVQIITDRADAASEAAVLESIEAHFRRAGLRISGSMATSRLKTMIEAQFNVIVFFLAIMAVLLATVGALGLAGTMSINVLERTREIGVMRAIGASNRAIQQIVLVEGVLIGLLSWGLGALLSAPMSRVLVDVVGQAFLRSPASYAFSFRGLAEWLVLVTVMSAVASFLPAWNASRITVRDVLSYE